MSHYFELLLYSHYCLTGTDPGWGHKGHMPPAYQNDALVGRLQIKVACKSRDFQAPVTRNGHDDAL